MIAGVQQHKQKGFPGTLRSFTLNGDHPLKGFFVQDLAFPGCYRRERRAN
jgi:hypothetical protein